MIQDGPRRHMERLVERENQRRFYGSILPAENRSVDYDILPFDQALHMTPQHPESPEVLLDVCIEHNQHSFSPVDDCEETCLKQIIEKLAALGVARAGGVR